MRAERELKATGEKLEETEEQLGCVTEKLEVEAHVAARAAQNAKQATVQGSQLQVSVCVGGWVCVGVGGWVGGCVCGGVCVCVCVCVCGVCDAENRDRQR